MDRNMFNTERNINSLCISSVNSTEQDSSESGVCFPSQYSLLLRPFYSSGSAPTELSFIASLLG